MRLNPMQPLISAYQEIFLDRTLPDFEPLLPLVILTIVFLFLGAGFFIARVGEMVDEL